VGLISRLGSNPPRNVVEDNIREIAKRIEDRKYYLVNCVQKAFRAWLTRRIVGYFKIEIFYLMQWKLNCVFKIQRIYRGYKARLCFLIMRDDQVMAGVKKGYDRFVELKLRKAKMSKALQLVHSAYIKELGEEKTVRFTSRIEQASNYGYKKTFAFAASIYQGDRLPKQMDHLLAVDAFNRKDESGIISHQRNRKKFIIDRIAEHGPAGFGVRGFAPDCIEEDAEKEKFDFLRSISNNKQVIAQRMVGDMSKFLPAPVEQPKGVFKRKEESSRSKSMRVFFREELGEIMDQTVHRIMHDFKKPDGGHLSRLQNYNAARKSTKLLEFKYPKDINEDPMQFVNDNIDDVMAHMDRKMKDGRNTS
jgi:IQ calmodulin-binding motif